MNLLKGECQRNAAAAVRDFKRMYRDHSISQMFINRSHDAEFANIGRVALGSKRASRADEHVLVWTGYELATDSRHAIFSTAGF